MLLYVWKFSLQDRWNRSGCLLFKCFSPSTNLMGLCFKFEELNQDSPLRDWNGFKSYKNISQICMRFKQENPSLRDLLIWIMQICYSDLNPPVKNIKGEIKHPENMERSERCIVTESYYLVIPWQMLCYRKQLRKNM